MFAPDDRLILIAGPCVIESEHACMHIAEKMIELAVRHGINYVFKASYDKANRTSVGSYRGPGITKGLEILRHIREAFKIPVLSDVHAVSEVAEAAEVLDIIQIPAFLSRQTDILVAAGKTGRTVNIKKAQFMAPADMAFAVRKVESTGTTKIMLTERGTMFGYGNLVVDFRGLPAMVSYGYPVIFDGTHSVQRPSAAGDGTTGGDRTMVPPLLRAAAAVGVQGIFLEVHEDPDRAKSDGPNSLKLEAVEKIITDVLKIREALQRP